MSTVERIEEQIRALSESEYEELRAWLIARDQNVWDAQIEGDSRAGKLHKLAETARQSHGAGKPTEL